MTMMKRYTSIPRDENNLSFLFFIDIVLFHFKCLHLFAEKETFHPSVHLVLTELESI